VADAVSKQYGIPSVEGDCRDSEAFIAMSASTPSFDEDRWLFS